MIATTPAIDQALAANAPVAAGISGGKDSGALLVALDQYLNGIGHTGPRLAIHSDLGRVEWRESLPQCESLAQRVGWELVVVRRQAGDLMDRWLVRWANNVARYANLECVKLILPWSTPAMRFCTSELKTAIICRELIKRFPGQTIISASGIRRDESAQRAKALVAQPQTKLTSKTHQTTGYDWHPIIDWSLSDVLAFHEAHGIPLHEAYMVYGASRVSCAFCIMSSRADLLAASSCPDNQDIYREMVDLEIVSSFSFQGGWLGDVAPQLLTEVQIAGLAEAKRKAEQRSTIEARIPKHLLYTKGWPTVMPSGAEARMLAEVRHEIGQLMEIEVRYTTADSIQGRYAELMRDRPAGLVVPVVQSRMELHV